MSYFCLVIFIFFIFFSGTSSMAAKEKTLFELSSREELVQLAGYGEEKLSTVLVTGSVHCEACLHGAAQLRAWPVSGALVAVNCHNHGKKSRPSWAKGVTDEFGDFIVDIPSQLHGIRNLEKTCSVKILWAPMNSPCRPAYVRKKKGIRLSSVRNSIRTYSAGRIMFLHFKSRPLQACMKKNGEKKMSW